MRSLSHISFDEFIYLISFNNITGKIPSEFHMQYLKLCNDTKEKSGTKKPVAHDEMLCVSESQSNAVSSLASSKKSYQMSIQAGMERVCKMNIRHSNNSILEMAIADFFHCKNIPDCVVESVCFKQLLDKARYVGSDFKTPSRKKIGGKFFSSDIYTYLC